MDQCYVMLRSIEMDLYLGQNLNWHSTNQRQQHQKLNQKDNVQRKSGKHTLYTTTTTAHFLPCLQLYLQFSFHSFIHFHTLWPHLFRRRWKRPQSEPPPQQPLVPLIITTQPLWLRFDCVQKEPFTYWAPVVHPFWWVLLMPRHRRTTPTFFGEAPLVQEAVAPLIPVNWSLLVVLHTTPPKRITSILPCK